MKDWTGWSRSHYFELSRKKTESYCNFCSCLQESREEAEGWRKPNRRGVDGEQKLKITGKEMLQGRCLLQVKRGTLINIFRSLLQSWHIWVNSAIQMSVILNNFQAKSTTCHRTAPTFKPKWLHPVTSLKQDERSHIFCCPQGQPCIWKTEIRGKKPEASNQESHPENINKKINLAETSAVVPEDGQHPSNTRSSCLWFLWHKN